MASFRFTQILLPLLGLSLSGPTSAAAQRPAPLTPGLLRVCADPDNLPFSNQAGEGVENKLAELLAKQWNARLEYVWWAAPRGLIRMLNGMYCDVIMQAPSEFDMAGVTRPYFRTSYVIVQRRNVAHQVTSLDDPALKTMKIGVHLFAADGENTPPAMALSAHGVVGNLVGFPTVYMGGMNHPDDIIKAVVSDSIDLAIVWGPIAGYYAQKESPPLTVVPLGAREGPLRLDFRITMGVRFQEPEWRHTINNLLRTKQNDINSILLSYGVPLLDEQGQLITH